MSIVVHDTVAVGTIEIEGYTFDVQGGALRVTDLATFGGKTVVGDYTAASDDLMSARSYGSFAGGLGIYREDEGANADRYWFGTLNARRARGLALADEVTTSTPITTGTARPLGDLRARDRLYVARGTQICELRADNTEVVKVGHVLPSAPVKKGVEWRGKLWIPLGVSGVAEYDGLAAPTIHGTVAAVALMVNDTELAALTVSGHIRTYDGAVWSAQTDAAWISPGVPRSLAIGRNSDGTKTLFAATDEGLWAYDRGTKTVYQTDLVIPPHPGHGRGFENWQGTLYMSAELGVYRYNGGTISAMGLDRSEGLNATFDQNDGLPEDLQGEIVDLQGALNEMYALVKGAPTTVPTPAFVLDQPHGEDDPLVETEAPTRASLQYWTSRAWHTAWVAAGAAGDPSWCVVSYAEDARRLVWGVGSSFHALAVTSRFANPRIATRAGQGRFQTTGYLQTAYFDYAMPGWPKLASHAEVNLDECPPGGVVTVRYKTDDATGWYTLGSVTQAGISYLPFGAAIPELQAQGEDFRRGLSFYELAAELSMTSPDPTKTPILTSAVVKLIKEPLRALSWEGQVDLRWDENRGLNPRAYADLLHEFARPQPRRFLLTKINDRYYRTRVSFVQGADVLGPEEGASRGLTIVEIRGDAR